MVVWDPFSSLCLVDLGWPLVLPSLPSPVLALGHKKITWFKLWEILNLMRLWARFLILFGPFLMSVEMGVSTGFWLRKDLNVQTRLALWRMKCFYEMQYKTRTTNQKVKRCSNMVQIVTLYEYIRLVWSFTKYLKVNM